MASRTEQKFLVRCSICEHVEQHLTLHPDRAVTTALHAVVLLARRMTLAELNEWQQDLEESTDPAPTRQPVDEFLVGKVEPS